ncbi:MAG TPA: DUF72 domain-containing protein [bacterium]|nr:DUF72 domain-containing protein [bacterium]
MYKDWEGIVYPRPKPPRFDPLRYIANFFDAVEINSTFYGPPMAKTATSWVQRVEEYEKFRFTAKLWKRFTHERDRAWTTGEVDQVRAGFDAMMESGHLGAVLLQFPWSFRRTEENREWLGDVARTFRHYPLVVEVRHSSWLKSMVTGARVPAPSGVFDAYGDTMAGYAEPHATRTAQGVPSLTARP